MKNILSSPSSNFNAVRDGRNSPDFYIDLNLGTTFDQTVNIAGNSFYVDANPADGNCTAYFQDTDKLSGPTPFYISPGFIARIPFTQIRFVNSVAQLGKKVRIVYGTDTDFQPGSVAQVAISTNTYTPEFQDAGGIGTGIIQNTVAARYGRIQLKNQNAFPILLDKVTFGAQATAGSCVFLLGFAGAADTYAYDCFRKSGGIDSNTTIGTAIDQTLTNISQRYIEIHATPGLPFEYTFKRPLLMASGTQIQTCAYLNAAAQFSAIFQYRYA